MSLVFLRSLNCRRRFIFAMGLLFAIFSLKSFAVTTSTLPPDIYSPAVRYGNIGGLDQRFNDSQSLVSLTDYNSIEFDAKTLARFNDKAKDLIASLNRFGAFKLGDALSLGVLEIKSKPEINYVAPLIAKGITKKWTIALGVPVIHYQNNVSLSQSFSNIDYYRKQFSGLSTELDQALNTDLGESTQQVLQQKGYRRLENRDQRFLGDAQLVSLYKFYDDVDTSAIYQTTLVLPTGPAYDTNDLMALNTFHKTAIENLISYSKYATAFWRITPYTSFKYTLPEKADMRVPTDEEDLLPNPDTIENINRQDGLAYELGLQNSYDVTDAFQLTLDYRLGAKTADHFSGGRNARYDLLSKDTQTRWQKTAVEISYSSVKSYFRDASALPFILTLSFFDTIAGQNIERRFGQELSATLFF